MKQYPYPEGTFGILGTHIEGSRRSCDLKNAKKQLVVPAFLVITTSSLCVVFFCEATPVFHFRARLDSKELEGVKIVQFLPLLFPPL